MQEAAKIALQTLDDYERLRQESYEKEARFERRRAFAEYGEAALIMMIDKGSGDPEMPDDGALSREDFLAEYGVEKKDVNYALVLLDLAITKGDHNKRNEIYDFFTGILE